MTNPQFQFKNLPVLLRVLIYLAFNYLLIFLAQIITGFLQLRGALSFNLLFCILLLLFTRFILKLEGKSFRQIGCVPGGRNDVIKLVAGILTGILMLTVTALSIKMVAGFHWILNPDFRWYQLLTSLLTIFCSVFAQELAFRGYPFRLMLDKWGEWPAQIFTAILFGCMHLSGGMEVKEMLLTIFSTGLGSILFGLAVIKTGRLHLAVGIHFGWNYAQYLLPRHISQNDGGIWLIQGGNTELNSFVWLAPYMITVVIVYFVIKLQNASPRLRMKEV